MLHWEVDISNGKRELSVGEMISPIGAACIDSCRATASALHKYDDLLFQLYIEL